MIKVHNIHIGAKSDLYQLNDDWAFVHACKTSHKERLGYTKPPKNEPYYIEFREQNHLYINWVDGNPHGLISATSPSFTSCQSFGADFSNFS